MSQHPMRADANVHSPFMIAARLLIPSILLLGAANAPALGQSAEPWRYKIDYDQMTGQLKRTLSLEFKVGRINGTLDLDCVDRKLALNFIAGSPTFANSDVLYKIDDKPVAKMPVSGTPRIVWAQSGEARKFVSAMMTGKSMLLRTTIITEGGSRDIPVELILFRELGAPLFRACRLEDRAKLCAGVGPAAKEADATQAAEVNLRKAYEELVQEFEESVVLRHILVKSEREAKAIIVQLQKGASFDKLVADRSLDRELGGKGQLGWFSRKRLPASFGDEVWNLAPGKLAEKPFKTERGWHVVMLEKRYQPWPKFGEIRKSLEQELADRVQFCEAQR